MNCLQVRRVSALRLVQQDDPAAGWQCAEPCHKPGGRPPIGPPVLIRMPAELRAAVEALARPGEKLAATARRLMTDAVAAAAQDSSGKPLTGSSARETEPDPPVGPSACPDCGGPRKLTLGNVAMCGQCGRIFGTPAAPVPAGYQPRQDGPAIVGSRGVLAEDRYGLPVLVGPVYSEKGVTAVRTLIEAHPGWTVMGAVRMVSKAHLEEHGDGMWR